MKRHIGQNLGGNAELQSTLLKEATHGVTNLRLLDI